MLPDILIGVIAFVVALVIGIPVGVLYARKWRKRRSSAPRKRPNASSTRPSRAPRAKNGKPWWKPRRKSWQKKPTTREKPRNAAPNCRSRNAVSSRRRDPGAEAGNDGAEEESYAARLANLEEARTQVAKLQAEQMETLERISGYTAEEAKEYLIAKLETESPTRPP